MKLCIDCVYVEARSIYAFGGFDCRAPQIVPDTNPVTGIKRYPEASFIRSSEEKCGLDARWFRPKQPKKKSWLGLFLVKD